jgi:hypothetical protein
VLAASCLLLDEQWQLTLGVEERIGINQIDVIHDCRGITDDVITYINPANQRKILYMTPNFLLLYVKRRNTAQPMSGRT